MRSIVVIDDESTVEAKISALTNHGGEEFSTHNDDDVKSFCHGIEHALLYAMTKAFDVFMTVGLDIVGHCDMLWLSSIGDETPFQ